MKSGVSCLSACQWNLMARPKEGKVRPSLSNWSIVRAVCWDQSKLCPRENSSGNLHFCQWRWVFCLLEQIVTILLFVGGNELPHITNTDLKKKKAIGRVSLCIQSLRSSRARVVQLCCAFSSSNTGAAFRFTGKLSYVGHAASSRECFVTAARYWYG